MAHNVLLAGARRGGLGRWAALRPGAASQQRHRGLGSSAPVSGEHYFDKILIANRGEIAIRVINTCRKLGIKTVAVHSDVDSNALHAVSADEKFLLGPAPSLDSYLNIDRYVEALAATGAQAVHPGYGFLSENKLFADKLDELGVAFIGPRSHAIEVMGDKLVSKQAAINAKVNTVPGFNGEVKDVDHAVEISNEIGYPVMIKASAGGGGKGMRVAWNDDEAREGFRFSKIEALNSFNDDRLLIEKFVDQPRHIEIQVLADSFGNTVYLNERECSIQRRNQKVIEEAPSVFVSPEMRKAMGEQACMLAKAVDYQSAGTVEFLADGDGNFYFLEMNTRLQVEHPITEMITGVDLVEQMIRVAAGKELSVKQSDIGINGWAVESRVYAEDSNTYLPSTGRLNTYQEPVKSDLLPGVRCDSGIVEGSNISIYYDPMISKLVTHGKDRADALKQMEYALDTYVIQGVKHNIPLLRDIIRQPKFLSGEITTNFLQETYPDGFHGFELSPADEQQLVAVCAFMHVSRQIQSQLFVNQGDMPEILYDEDLSVTLPTGVHTVSVAAYDEDTVHVEFAPVDGEGEGTAVVVEGAYTLGQHLVQVNVNQELVVVQSHGRSGSNMSLRYKGSPLDVAVRSQEEQKLFELFPEKAEDDKTLVVETPMPGSLISVAVSVGDSVFEGQEVAVVEAMKMQNMLLAPRTGTIKAVHAEAGATLAEGDLILEFVDDTAVDSSK